VRSVGANERRPPRDGACCDDQRVVVEPGHAAVCATDEDFLAVRIDLFRAAVGQDGDVPEIRTVGEVLPLRSFATHEEGRPHTL
jgi:hypothetical protein